MDRYNQSQLNQLVAADGFANLTRIEELADAIARDEIESVDFQDRKQLSDWDKQLLSKLGRLEAWQQADNAEYQDQSAYWEYSGCAAIFPGVVDFVDPFEFAKS